MQGTHRIPDAQSAIVLRRIEPRDVAQLQALHEDWFPIRYNESFYQHAGQGMWENGEPLFTQVALCNEDIIGAVTAQIQRCDDTEDKCLIHQSKDTSTTLMYILTLGARQDYRRKGIASVLLTTCINEAKADSSCRALYLHVKADNGQAIRFYEKNGFHRLRFLEGEVGCMLLLGQVNNVLHSRGRLLFHQWPQPSCIFIHPVRQRRRRASQMAGPHFQTALHASRVLDEVVWRWRAQGARRGVECRIPRVII
ncbi:hypothetical protein H257_17189 [Aphanomyces astaci]|uniref:N-alpha-acetyltransferase 60 n=2 Tax=Aphanomyces astaci TaxID=112090 RepID=W4FI36_APHAT|nr:hypothetical protein H257_17189 [Aphanomyces astaci]ETV66413.1 hypothetical protein H257_17189 [Aphanomyces astaci]|eukprot:XP_009844188.1 hypothetical protein H257_17189 [Aphanomyces astaci]